MIQAGKGPETVGSHLQILCFFRHLVFQFVIRNLELRGHVVELLCQLADLIVSFNGHLMRQMATADLLHAFAESGDGTSKTAAEDVGESEVDHQADTGEAKDKPELLLNEGLENGLRLLDHHPPVCHG